ncbi:MAG: transporter [Herbaspirillum sp.]|nr:transporter [Herbaspirillum sp.]
MQIVAVAWQVYQLTGSAFDLGLVGLVQFIPSIFLVFIVGHIADRYDRRRIAMFCVLLEGTCALTLAIGSAGGWLNKEVIFAVVFMIGVGRAFSMPIMSTLVSALVPPAVLPRAIATFASATQFAVIIGPALGGLLYVFGAGAVYASSCALFFLSSFLISRIRIERPVTAKAPVTMKSLFAGIGFIRSRPAIFGAVSLALFAVLLGGATALLPIYAHDILHTGSVGLGLLRSAPAVGALCIGVYLARHPLKNRIGRTMYIGVGIYGLATVVFAVSHWFLLSLLMLVVLGAADMISVVVRSSFVQLQTPDAMRGRVGAVNSVFVGTSNQLGEFESGVMAAWLGAVPAVVVGGLGTLIVVLLWIRVFPELFNVDRLTPIEDHETASAVQKAA